MKIEKRLRAYFQEQPRFGVVSAYLFGSHGAGRPHRESDVDVGVLLDRQRHPGRRERFEVRDRLADHLTE